MLCYVMLCYVIVKDRVVNFWQALNVFNPNQFGFLERKSTLTQLLCCFDDWESSRNKSRPTDVIFLDFSKAFDSVFHERLLLKLKCHGINGSLLHWFRSFLTDEGLPRGFLVPFQNCPLFSCSNTFSLFVPL